MKKFVRTTTFLMIILVWCTTVVIAANSSELNQQKSEINKQINEKEEQLENVQAEMSDTLKEIQNVSSQISQYEDEIASLDSKIEALKTSINEAEKRIEEKEQKYQEQQQAMDEKLVAMYEAGETTYLDVLLSSQDFTDMLSNYFIISQLAQNDIDMLESIEQQKREIEEEKTKLEENKNEVVTAKSQKEAKATELKSLKEEKDNYANKLSEDEKAIQQELDRFKQDQKDIENKLAEIARQEAAKNNGNSQYVPSTPSASGYISPIDGLSKRSITCGFYGYSGHTGADFSGGLYGRTVRAVKSGTVVISQSTYGSIPNYGSNGSYVGSYRSYGEYIVINHHDGTMTAYAHGQPGSRKVKEGQEVSQGQAIMNVGNTGNVLPRPTPSDPLRGTHLHFEVRVNGRCVDPAPYLP